MGQSHSTLPPPGPRLLSANLHRPPRGQSRRGRRGERLTYIKMYSHTLLKRLLGPIPKLHVGSGNEIRGYWVPYPNCTLGLGYCVPYPNCTLGLGMRPRGYMYFQWLTSCVDLAAPDSLRGLGATVGGNFLRALGGVIVMEARVMLSTVCVCATEYTCMFIELHINTKTAALKLLVTGRKQLACKLLVCAITYTKQNHSSEPARASCTHTHIHTHTHTHTHTYTTRTIFVQVS